MKVFDLQYFPPISFFSTLFKETNVEIDKYELYRKTSFRNRCMIAGAEGIISLTVPLLNGRNQRLAVKDIMISDAEAWQSRHYKSIRSSYSRSPYFEFYGDDLEMIFKEKFIRLADWNMYCLTWILKKLNYRGHLKWSSEAVPFAPDNQDDFRDRVLPKNYRDFSPVKYHQVFEDKTGFLPNLSILDLLFNAGNRAGDYLLDLK